MRIEIPEFSLVAMIGATSSGKTTFANAKFNKTEVLSSDFFRAMVSDDENDQSATGDAFDLLYYAARKRLSRMKLTVIDATNVQKSARQRILELAKKQDVHAIAIVLDLPERVLLERNASPSGRGLPERVIKSHCADLRRGIRNLRREGFRYVYVLSSEDEIAEAEIVRTKLWCDKRELHGPFDVIGDIHGCFDELCELLNKLGYVRGDDGVMRHPDGRLAAFLGDFCDRGPKNVDVLKLVIEMVRSGAAIAVPGNHDVKLVKYLRGKDVKPTHGLDATIAELEAESAEFRADAAEFLDGLISHNVLDDGKLVIAHAGLREEYIGRGSARVRNFCLYGETTGETDEFGLPVRIDWASEYTGRATVVYGHTPSRETVAQNGTFCIDTGCVFGGKLTAFRYPERETVSVDAHRQYYEPAKPLDLPEENAPGADEGDVLKISGVSGRLHIETELAGTVIIGENNSAAALEVMSRYAADPRWLIYLPPTMSPCETSPFDGWLEHPAEAFSYYRRCGEKYVVCEKKHMGSRAVIVICRDAESAERRFRVNDGSRGIIYTRTGRRFFDDPSTEASLLDRLGASLEKSGFWDSFETDWACIDAELLPWSEKAQGLLKEQYAPTGCAGKYALSAAISLIETASAREDIVSGGDGRDADLSVLLDKYRFRRDAVYRYIDAYGEYCWRVGSVDDLRVAPFHLLACEGRVFGDKPHVWHMETLKKYVTGSDPVFIATPYITVDVNDEKSVANGVEWWMKLTDEGGEGMVVKPESYIARDGAKLFQPAVKCRGREYLRIIYGPEYLFLDNLERLKKRSLSRKRSLALREFALGMESLDRFVRNEPLFRVHECVFGVLALESEPVDPRL